MRSAVSVTFAVAALVGLTGCGGVHGMWRLDSVEPADSPRNYAMSCMVLDDDGSYKACADPAATKMVMMSGRYTHDEDAQKLTFYVGEGEPPRTYNYELGDDKLTLMADANGRTIAAHYTRAKDSEMCDECCCPIGQCKCEDEDEGERK